MKTMDNIRRILIVKTSSLGDIVHTFPAVHALARALPQAQIDWLANTEYQSLVLTHPDVSNVLDYPRKAFNSFKTFLPAARAILKKIRAEKYDCIIDFHGIFRASFFTRFSGAPLRIGFAQTPDHISSVFYNKKIRLPQTVRHAIDRYAQLIRRAFELPDDFDLLCWPTLRFSESVKAQAAELLPDAPGYAATIAIVTGARWESKKFSTAFFAQIINSVAAKAKIRFVLLGGPGDLTDAQEVEKCCPHADIVSLAGRTDAQTLFAVIARCQALIASDTGPLHMAVALNIPTFSFFAPNDPAVSGPRGQVNHHIYTAPISCSPCLKRVCPRKTEAQLMPCHALIHPETVADDIVRFFTKEESPHESK